MFCSIKFGTSHLGGQWSFAERDYRPILPNEQREPRSLGSEGLQRQKMGVLNLMRAAFMAGVGLAVGGSPGHRRRYAFGKRMVDRASRGFTGLPGEYAGGVSGGVGAGS